MNTREQTRQIAQTRYRNMGGVGPVPEAGVDLVEREMRSERAAEDAGRVAAGGETFKRQSTPMAGPEEKRTVRPVSELRSAVDKAGNKHTLYSREQRMSDYEEPRNSLSFADYLNMRLQSHVGNYSRVQNEIQELRADYSENTNSLGGHLVPNFLSATVIDDVRAANRVFQAGATTMEMQTDRVSIAKIESDMVPLLAAENVAIGFSAGSFSAIGLTAKKIGVCLALSKELIEDGIGVGSLVQSQLATVMAQTIDDLALNGAITDGQSSSHFLSLMNATSIGETGSIGGNLDWDNWINAMYQVEALNGTASTVICNPAMMNHLRKLKSATDEIYLLPPKSIENLNILTTTKCPSGSAVFGSFDRLLIGIRRDITIDITDVAGDSFAKDQVWLKATMRLDTALTQPLFYRLAGATYS